MLTFTLEVEVLVMQPYKRRSAAARALAWAANRAGQGQTSQKTFAAVLDAGATSKLSVESNVWFAACTINLDGFCRSDAVQGGS